MTTTDTTKALRPVAWLRYSREVDAQIAAHTTPAEVKAAYQAYLAGSTTPRVVLVNDAPYVEEFFPARSTGTRSYSAPIAKVVNGASEKQKSYLRSLVAKVGRLPGHIVLDLDTEIDAMTSREASAAIDRCLAAIKAAPVAPAPVVEAPAAPVRARLDFSAISDGYYALRVEGVVKFYRVSTNKKGYKNVQAQAGDELHLMWGNAGIAVLHRLVEAGLEGSMKLYAEELGRCWTCGRTLTDEESRAAGQGPICRGK
jgi:hypothetical protein